MNNSATLSKEPLSRNTDPATSFQAAEGLARSERWQSQKQAVLQALRCHPYVTSAELANIMGIRDRYICSRRLADLANEQKVYRRRARRCRVTHRICLTWYAPKPGADLFGNLIRERN